MTAGRASQSIEAAAWRISDLTASVSFEQPVDRVGLGPALRVLPDMFAHRLSPCLIHVFREEVRPIRPGQLRSAHGSIPNTGASRFRRFWTALKWSDLAVPIEIFIVSEISLNWSSL